MLIKVGIYRDLRPWCNYCSVLMALYKNFYIPPQANNKEDETLQPDNQKYNFESNSVLSKVVNFT